MLMCLGKVFFCKKVNVTLVSEDYRVPLFYVLSKNFKLNCPFINVAKTFGQNFILCG